MPHTRLTRLAVLIALFVCPGPSAAQEFLPPRIEHGTVPAQPPQVAAGGQVLLEVSVGADGRVDRLRPLRVTPPYDLLTRQAVQAWSFKPAQDAMERQPVPARVLVAAIFRPPTLYNAPSIGEPPRDVATASGEIPFPNSIVPPVYPANALGDALVLVELLVGSDGSVRAAAVLRSAGSGFDDSAMRAAKQWTFRPARRSGLAVASYAYLIFGFRAPVVVSPGPPR